jgi:DNA-binding transcriptional ArsR family regulator
MVLVHHTRKSAADDYLESISGTNGLTGGSDAVMVLERGQEGTYALKGRGRDIEEFDVAMRFDKESCRWSVLGDAQEARQSETRSKILRFLGEVSWPVGAGEIAAQLGMTSNTVTQRLHHMTKAGEVERVGRGKYTLPSKSFVVEGGRRDDPDDDDD